MGGIGGGGGGGICSRGGSEFERRILLQVVSQCGEDCVQPDDGSVQERQDCGSWDPPPGVPRLHGSGKMIEECLPPTFVIVSGGDLKNQ